MPSFQNISLSHDLLKNLDSLGFTEMTPVQEQSLPVILSGRDITVQAKTGSGKTIAFGLGLVNKVDAQLKAPSSLVLCPTRELAAQVAAELRKLSRAIPNVKILTLCGGSPVYPQINSLEFGANIIVGTPGRVLDHLDRDTLNLRSVDQIVLDEADRMLDMGFSEEIDAILGHAKTSRQTMLFSATYPENIRHLSNRIQKKAVFIKDEGKKANLDIEQVFYKVDPAKRDKTLLAVLAKHNPESSIVFCTTKIECDQVTTMLKQNGVTAAALHGGLEQYERDKVMVLFTHKSLPVIVATDVAARGLDVKNLDLVLNYELTKNPEVHVHRIGRTGRAGQKGLAISLVAGEKEAYRLKDICEYLEQKLPLQKFKENLNVPVNIRPKMTTLKISGGKKNKVRPGDILGALVKEVKIDANKIGKITVFDFYAYVAVETKAARSKVGKPKDIKIKNKMLRARIA